MNSEQIEHQLSQIATNNDNLTGNVADVVRPGYGTQSDSWVGYLTIVGRDYPLLFQFQHGDGCIIFTANDVVRIDPPKDPNDERNNQPIIRLKGPYDYRENLVTA